MLDYIFIILLFPIIAIPLILLSPKLNLLDPPKKNKIHKNEIPNVLGAAIYIYLFVLVSVDEISYSIEAIIAYGSLIVFIGFLDDRIELTPGVKLFFVSAPIIGLIFNGFDLKDIGNYEYINVISLGKFSFIFVLLASLVVINAFNYIDGIDGLSISISISAILYFIFLSDQDDQYVKLLLYILYALIISFLLNLLPAKSALKSFLGNSGSLFLGFLISFLMIFLYKNENIHPSLLIWSCWLPVYDFLRVTIIRIYKKKNFLKKDNEHLHYKILKLFNGNQVKTLILINFFNILILLSGYMISTYYAKIYSLILYVGFFFIYLYLVNSSKIFQKK